MLTLAPAQLDRLDDRVALQFVERLMERLAATFPDAHAAQPAFVRRQMVANGLSIAAGFGFTLQSTLGGFVALQYETSADFHVLPEAQAILASEATERRRLDRLVADIPAGTWDTVKRGADVRAWFESAKASQTPARIAARVCPLFPEWRARRTEAGWEALYRHAVAAAPRHRLVTDAGLAVLAAAMVVYGEGIDGPGAPDWAVGVFHGQPLSPERKVALLRMRLLLDTDRLV